MGTVESIQREHDLRPALRALIKERGWSMAEVARRVGVTSTVVSAWLRAKYRGDNERISDLVLRLINTERDADDLTTGLDRHADLAVTGEVVGVAAHAHANADLTVIYGAAGGGKTKALERYCEQHSGAWLVTMAPWVTTPSAVLGAIADALDGAASETTAARLARAVVARLSIGRALLVIDESHHLSQPLLDVVRCVHDEARCGLVLAGNEPLWARLARGERAAQLVSRVGIRYHLRRPSATDALALAQALLGRPVETGGRKAVLGAGEGVGALRSVRKLIAQAQILARGDGRDAATDQDLTDAAELLGA